MGLYTVYMPHTQKCIVSPLRTVYIVVTREKRDLEREMPREYWYLSEGGPLCTEQAASTVNPVLQSDPVQNIRCWLACSVHNGPPSPKFQILPSQLRQTADRAAGLSIKSLWSSLRGPQVLCPVLCGPVHKRYWPACPCSIGCVLNTDASWQHITQNGEQCSCVLYT